MLQTFTGALGQATREERVTSDKEAKKLAFYLFWNIKPFALERNYLLPEDLEQFYGDPKEAQEAFELLDISGDGQITLKEIRDVIVNMYKVASPFTIAR